MVTPFLSSPCPSALAGSPNSTANAFISLRPLILGGPFSQHRNLGTRFGKHGRRCSCSVVCMAHPRRVKMVAQQIRRELGDMLLKDKVLQQAVLPEVALGADMYLSSLATISDVEVSRDLQVAKVYVSVYGDERGKEIVMEGLKAKTKYVRAGLGKRMSLRMTPEVRFILDESLERGSRVVAILDKLQKERKQGETGNAKLKDAEYDSWDDTLNEEVGDDTLQMTEGGKTESRKEAAARGGEDDDDDFYAEDENIIYIR